MSRRYWGSYTPIGVGLAVFVLLSAVGLHNHQNQGRAPDSSTQQHRADSPQRAEPPAIGPVVDEAPVRNPNPDREEWREEQDLEAQQDMAEWAFRLLVATWVSLAVSGAGVVVAVAGIIYVRRSLDLSRRAIRSERRIGQAQTRAYVNISAATIHDIEPGHVPYAIIILKNSGSTPAYNIQRTAWIKFENLPLTAPLEYIPKPSSNPSVFTLGSGETNTIRIRAGDTVDERMVSIIRSGRGGVFVYGIATYTDIFKAKHQTRFRYLHSARADDPNALRICAEGNESD